MKKSTFLQEDLRFLAQVLQEQLRAEVPSGEFFRVKCVVKNDKMMILTQHPQGVATDTEEVFDLLTEVLLAIPSHQEQDVELYLRIAGVKLPYAKRSLTVVPNGNMASSTPSIAADFVEVPEETPQTTEQETDFSATSPLIFADDALVENYDPMADMPETSVTYNPPGKYRGILGAGILALVVLMGTGTYLLTRPCVLSGCKQLQDAQELQRQLQQKSGSLKSEKELSGLEKRLTEVGEELKVIPAWSPSGGEAATLAANLSEQAQIINQVQQALKAGSVAIEKSQAPAKNLQDLQSRQQMWRQAIAPLEAVKPNSPAYDLIQPKLAVYRVGLQAINQQLQTEERWLQKLAAAQKVAQAATQREGTAKTLQDWQRVQFTWQIAVNALSPIPQTSSAYPEAQRLLTEYKPKLSVNRDRATRELLAAKTYNQAISAAAQARTYGEQKQWQKAVVYWNQALTSIKQVTPGSIYANQSQNLLDSYSTSLRQAEEQLQMATVQQKNQTDLEKTCSGTVRICNYTIDERGIIVNITPEYEQTLAANINAAKTQNDATTFNSVTNHLQILQQALEVISDNANLPLVVYDAQGQQIHQHMP
ncbi:hypothetical protein IJ00_01415 [Calothrix sp. 336/3]|nr:hypothetical protein IJ00_01415 [Calothrix sp. 336/3]